MPKYRAALLSVLLFASCARMLPARTDPVVVGEPAPALTLTAATGIDGVPPTLDDYRGRILVLEFWYTTCAPCVNIGLPHMNELATELAADNRIAFLSVTYEPPERTARFLQRVPMRTPIGHDTERETWRAWGVNSAPRTVVVDQAGVVLADTYPTQISAAMLRAAADGDATPFGALADANADVTSPPLVESRPEQEPAMEFSLTVRSREGTPRPSISSGGNNFQVTDAPLRFLLTWTIAAGGRIDGDAALLDDTLVSGYFRTTVLEPYSPEATEFIATLLEHTLHVTFEHEAREELVHVLRLAPEWEQRFERAEHFGSMSCRDGSATAVGLPRDWLVALLGESTDLTLTSEIEDDGLSYDYSLTWTPGDIESLRAALRKQLGVIMEDRMEERTWLIVKRREP